MDPVDPGSVAMLLRPVERRQRAVLLELRREPVSVAEDFLAPLEALGAARPKGMAVAAWKAGLARLVDDLRYLEPDELALLRRDVEVGLRQTRVWLPPVAILSMAALIRPDPRAQAERAASIARFMRSAPGRAALAGGYAVEMLASAEACGHGFRVTDFQIGRWQAAAAERGRHLELDRARAAAGDLPAAARVAAVEARQRRAMELCRSGEE